MRYHPTPVSIAIINKTSKNLLMFFKSIYISSSPQLFSQTNRKSLSQSLFLPLTQYFCLFSLVHPPAHLQKKKIENCISEKGLICRIYKETSKLHSQKTTQLKRSNYLNRHFPIKDTTLAHKSPFPFVFTWCFLCVSLS